MRGVSAAPVEASDGCAGSPQYEETLIRGAPTVRQRSGCVPLPSPRLGRPMGGSPPLAGQPPESSRPSLGIVVFLAKFSSKSARHPDIILNVQAQYFVLTTFPVSIYWAPPLLEALAQCRENRRKQEAGCRLIFCPAMSINRLDSGTDKVNGRMVDLGSLGRMRCPFDCRFAVMSHAISEPAGVKPGSQGMDCQKFTTVDQTCPGTA
jgi:hypothetical protein